MQFRNVSVPLAGVWARPPKSQQGGAQRGGWGAVGRDQGLLNSRPSLRARLGGGGGVGWVGIVGQRER